MGSSRMCKSNVIGITGTEDDAVSWSTDKSNTNNKINKTGDNTDNEDKWGIQTINKN